MEGKIHLEEILKLYPMHLYSIREIGMFLWHYWCPSIYSNKKRHSGGFGEFSVYTVVLALLQQVSNIYLYLIKMINKCTGQQGIFPLSTKKIYFQLFPILSLTEVWLQTLNLVLVLRLSMCQWAELYIALTWCGGHWGSHVFPPEHSPHPELAYHWPERAMCSLHLAYEVRRRFLRGGLGRLIASSWRAWGCWSYFKLLLCQQLWGKPRSFCRKDKRKHNNFRIKANHGICT